jgi:hypothetical protein
MGLQRSKIFFLLQISWISQTDEFHHNFAVQSYAIFATGSATSSKLLGSQLGLCAYRFHLNPVRLRRFWVVLTGPPWGSNNVVFFLQSILISRASSTVDSLCTWNWLYYKWSQWVAVRLVGRLRKRAESVSEYDTHKKQCFWWGQILLVFDQNIWDNFWIFYFYFLVFTIYNVTSVWDHRIH